MRPLPVAAGVLPPGATLPDGRIQPQNPAVNLTRLTAEIPPLLGFPPGETACSD
jgi:hypothetical protein